MYKLFFIIFCSVLIITYGRKTRLDDICGNFDGRRMYLELGEHGVLVAKDNPNGIKVSNKYDRNFSPLKQCSLELITCPSCIVTVEFKFLNITRICGKNAVLDTCGCDYVWLYEPPYENISGEQFCGHFVENNITSLIYRSQTRTIAIAFLYSQIHTHAFTLEYTAERNRQFYTGYPKYGNKNNSSQVISSPYFPYIYPRDLSVEYVIKCKTDVQCRISLIFTDFQIASSSLIELFDWNGQRMYVTTGSLFRPPVLISSGPTMVVRFYANGGTNLGFKAVYSFLLEEMDNTTLKPYTDCGGYVDNLGGGITMMNMIDEGTRAYDCFWIIRPPESYLHLKTHLYLKITAFSGFAGTTELIVRQGLTSNEPIVEILRHPLSQNLISRQKEHIVSISQGFYVSLKGLFRPETRLTIVYTAFSYKGCYSGSDFLCNNHRCISVLLNCNGFDNCGDRSDESATCSKNPKERLWSHKPNFFFPKIDHYTDLKTATIVFVVCSLGLISLIFALIIILYRLNKQTHNRRQMEEHLQTISDLLEESLHIDEEIVFSDEPPNYEAPPDYEEVIKKNNKESKMDEILNASSLLSKRPCSRCTRLSNGSNQYLQDDDNEFKASTSHQTRLLIPDSPPPPYSNHISGEIEEHDDISSIVLDDITSIILDDAHEDSQSLDNVVSGFPQQQSQNNSDEILAVSCHRNADIHIDLHIPSLYSEENRSTEPSEALTEDTHLILSNDSSKSSSRQNLGYYFDHSVFLNWLQDTDKWKNFNDWKRELKSYCLKKSKILDTISTKGFVSRRRFSDGELFYVRYLENQNVSYENVASSVMASVRRSVSSQNVDLVLNNTI